MSNVRVSPVQVPEVCVNGNYPPDLLDEEGNVDFPDFLPPLSDFILQVRNSSARHNRQCQERVKHC